MIIVMKAGRGKGNCRSQWWASGKTARWFRPDFNPADTERCHADCADDDGDDDDDDGDDDDGGDGDDDHDSSNLTSNDI